MIPNNVANKPYRSRSAFVVYNRASSSNDKDAIFEINGCFLDVVALWWP